MTTMRITKVVLTAITAVLLLAHCNTVGPAATPATVTDQGDCAYACANLQVLHCPQAEPISLLHTCSVDADCLAPDGSHDQYQTCAANGQCMVTCVNFCISTENTGVWLDPTCVKGVTSCSQVDACVVVTNGSSCDGSSCKVAPNHAKP
jgi:hypothetical protein